MKPCAPQTFRWFQAAGLLSLALPAILAAPRTGQAETAPSPREQDGRAQLPAPQEQTPAQVDPGARAEKPQESELPQTGKLGREGRGQLGSLTGKSGDANAMLWRMLASVLIIAILGAAAYFGIRRLGPRFRLVPKRKIHLIETLPLGARKSLHLVEVDGQRLLLGASRENVAILTELAAADAEGAGESFSSEDTHAKRKTAGGSQNETKGSFQSALQEQMQ